MNEHPAPLTPDEISARSEAIENEMDELRHAADDLARKCADALATHSLDSGPRARRYADDRDAIISQIDALRIESNRL